MRNRPDEMQPSDRLAEIASILAEAMLRLKCKKAIKSNKLREISLDSFGNQSVHAHETSTTGKKP